MIPGGLRGLVLTLGVSLIAVGMVVMRDSALLSLVLSFVGGALTTGSQVRPR